MGAAGVEKEEPPEVVCASSRASRLGLMPMWG
jgi:hypothetical protein